MLWFDVEEGYNTTLDDKVRREYRLWFDVEEGYNTTNLGAQAPVHSCGLM